MKVSSRLIRGGFVAAAAYNASILFFSRGLSDNLGNVDALFGRSGIVLVLLWGAAYLAAARPQSLNPWMAAVFCVEKIFYAGHWAVWTASHRHQLPAISARDALSASFFGSYGIGDAAFALFFGFAAWRAAKTTPASSELNK